jgi:hypothetical protein
MAKSETDIFKLHRDHPSLGREIARLQAIKLPTAGPLVPAAEQAPLPGMETVPVMHRRTWRRKLQDEARFDLSIAQQLRGDEGLRAP